MNIDGRNDTDYERIIDSRSTVKRGEKQNRRYHMEENDESARVPERVTRTADGRSDTSREKVTTARFDTRIDFASQSSQTVRVPHLIGTQRRFARFSSSTKTGFRFSERSKG